MKYYCMMAVLCTLLLRAAPAPGQEMEATAGFFGHGIAQIVAGDIPAARQQALVDAQRKCMIAAIGALVPTEALTGGITLLKPRLLAQPEQYIERFKIIAESTLAGRYCVTVQAYPQEALLRQELEATGLIARQADQPQALLMIAERAEPQTDFSCWWASPAGLPQPGEAHRRLAERLARTGITIAKAAELEGAEASAGAIACPDVTAADASRIAARFNAGYAVTGRATLSPVRDGDIQCNISVSVIDARTQETALQAAASALGRRASPQGPAADALDRACAQLAEQIAERFFQHTRAVRSYTFRLNFTKPMMREDVQRCMNAFAAVLPGIAVQDLRGDAGGRIWTVETTSPAPSAEALQQQFGPGVPGYVSRIVSARDNTIDIRVTPIARSGE